MEEAKQPFIDAHHHLWDLQVCRYPWLLAKGVKRFFGDPTPIQQNYLPAHFLSESQRYVPSKSVHIQVGVAAGDELAETAWLQQLGACPAAIVAATDLSAPDLAKTLHRQQSFEKLRGVRQILGRHVEEDKKHGSDALLDNPHFVAGLKYLASQRLSFDLQMIPQQMPRVLAIMEQIPELQVALCHCGSPWEQTPGELASWREGLRRFAELPNSVCKISGLGMFNPTWTTDTLRPIILEVIEIFGPSRVMLGSNFPVDKLYNTYDALWDAYGEITAVFTAAERRQLYHDTAARFYRI